MDRAEFRPDFVPICASGPHGPARGGVPEKTKVKVFVIDHIERPTPD
jgi:hypothetical protein